MAFRFSPGNLIYMRAIFDNGQFGFLQKRTTNNKKAILLDIFHFSEKVMQTKQIKLIPWCQILNKRENLIINA